MEELDFTKNPETSTDHKEIVRSVLHGVVQNDALLKDLQSFAPTAPIAQVAASFAMSCADYVVRIYAERAANRE